jgi:PKD repeat protein
MRATAAALAVVGAWLAGSGVRPGLANAESSLYVTVQAANPVQPTTVTDEQIANNTDLSSDVLNHIVRPSCMTMKALAEFVGIAPASISAVTVGRPDGLEGTETLTGDQVVNGFADDPYTSDTEPAYAIFLPDSSDDFAAAIDFIWVGSPDLTHGIPGPYGGVLDVNFVLSGSVLTIGPPSPSSTSPTAGNPVQFTAPSVLLNGAPDTNSLSYSWDFGDGSPVSAAPSPSHVYSTAGTYDARVTVTDNVTGAEGVSTPAAVIDVGAAPSKTTSTPETTTPAGTGSPQAPSSGADTGESPVPAASPTPKSGAPKKKTPKKKSPKRRPLSTTGAGTGSSGSGSGGSGSGGGGSGSGGNGSGSAGDRSGADGTASATKSNPRSSAGAGAHTGSQPAPKDRSVPRSAQTRELFGVLIDSRGATLLLGGSEDSPLAKARAAARGGARTDSSVGWLTWLLEGIVALAAVSLGALAEFGPRARFRGVAT